MTLKEAASVGLNWLCIFYAAGKGLTIPPTAAKH
jgi:hypothetical protein